MKIIKINKNTFGLLLLFFIWPFGSFLYAIAKFSRKEAKLIIYLFFILFGLTFVLGNEKLDSFRYAEYFEEMTKYSLSEFKLILSGLFLSENSLDLASPTISFIVSRFTSDHRFLFGVIAAIFGFFYIKSIIIVYNNYELNKNLLSLLFLLIFILILNPIFNINGYRFYIATWIYFLFAYYYLLRNEKKYWLLASISILFHFSFIAPVVLLILYGFMGNKNKLYIIFIIASFFISDVIFQLFPQVIPMFGEGIATKAGRYANTDRMEQVAEHAEWAMQQGKWYLYLPRKMIFYFITFVFFYLGNKIKHTERSSIQNNLFSFSLFFLAFSNTFSFIPSMNRFQTLFMLFGTTFIISLLAFNKIKRPSWLFFIGLLPFCLNLIIVLRLGIDVLNPLLFTLLPFPFIFNEISVYQWLFN